MRLAPDAFWSLSIPELLAIVEAAYGRDLPMRPMASDDLAALIARYPDQVSH